MPRANRYFLTGSCLAYHPSVSLAGFSVQVFPRQNRYLRWLYEARKRFGLCVLNYVVTSNHIHSLVKGTEESVIARSMQLAAARTAQDYNRRKTRLSGFCENRYDATALQTDAHLHPCLIYIDLNMVRDGAVRLQRCPILPGGASPMGLCCAARRPNGEQTNRWSESVAVGSEQFVEQVKTELGSAVGRRQIIAADKTSLCAKR